MKYFLYFLDFFTHRDYVVSVNVYYYIHTYRVVQVTHCHYNYNGAECPNKYWFWQIFTFFQNYQNQGQLTEGKEKKKNNDNEEESNQNVSVSTVSNL